MSVEVKMVYVKCPLCGSDDNKEAYTRTIENASKMDKIRNVICNDCGLMYMNPRPAPKATARYYTGDTSASGNTYHRTDCGSRHDLLTQERVRFLQQHIKKGQYGLLLDIGCSTGDFLLDLKLSGWELRGLELSPYAVKIAQRRGLNVICESIETAKLWSNQFDVICCISTLEHFHDPALAISKMGQALKPDGNMMIEVPDSTKPVAQVADFYSNEHLTHFTKGTLLRLLAKYNIEVCSIESGINFPVLRVWARRVEVANISRVLDDREELLVALAKYKDRRRELERRIVERFSTLVTTWKEKSSRVAIYGAGMHSSFLLETVDFQGCISCFLDSDPKKKNTTFLEWNVYGPESIDKLKLDAIIISSRDYQEEIFHTIARYQAQGIDIVRCYP